MNQPKKFIDHPELRKLLGTTETDDATTRNSDLKVEPASEGEVDIFRRISTPESLIDTIRRRSGNEIVAVRALAKQLKKQ